MKSELGAVNNGGCLAAVWCQGLTRKSWLCVRPPSEGALDMLKLRGKGGGGETERETGVRRLNTPLKAYQNIVLVNRKFQTNVLNFFKPRLPF